MITKHQQAILKERQEMTRRWARGQKVWWPKVEKQNEKEMQGMRIDWENGKIIRDSGRPRKSATIL
jgi:hypothetical protein